MKAELFNYKCWIEASDPDQLKIAFNNLLDLCDFEKLGFLEHHFLPQGYTCIWLLGESHLAVHTYPEHGRAYLELTSCSLDKNKRFKELLATQFTRLEQHEENLASSE